MGSWGTRVCSKVLNGVSLAYVSAAYTVSVQVNSVHAIMRGLAGHLWFARLSQPRMIMCDPIPSVVSTRDPIPSVVYV